MVPVIGAVGGDFSVMGPIGDCDARDDARIVTLLVVVTLGIVTVAGGCLRGS